MFRSFGLLFTKMELVVHRPQKQQPLYLEPSMAEKGVNMDRALHITLRPMLFSSSDRRHPKAWAGSHFSDSKNIRPLRALLSNSGGRRSLRNGEEGAYLDHSLKVTQLIPSCVLLYHAAFWPTSGSQRGAP